MGSREWICIVEWTSCARTASGCGENIVLKAEPLENGRGMRFLEYRWLELSLVVVPAQPQARITGMRAA